MKVDFKRIPLNVHKIDSEIKRASLNLDEIIKRNNDDISKFVCVKYKVRGYRDANIIYKILWDNHTLEVNRKGVVIKNKGTIRDDSFPTVYEHVFSDNIWITRIEIGAKYANFEKSNSCYGVPYIGVTVYYGEESFSYEKKFIERTINKEKTGVLYIIKPDYSDEFYILGNEGFVDKVIRKPNLLIR